MSGRGCKGDGLTAFDERWAFPAGSAFPTRTVSEAWLAFDERGVFPAGSAFDKR